MLPNDGPVANAPIHLFLNSYTLTLPMLYHESTVQVDLRQSVSHGIDGGVRNKVDVLDTKIIKVSSKTNCIVFKP